MRRVVIAFLLSGLVSACASNAPTTSPDEPVTHPRQKLATSTSILGAADRELRGLFQDVQSAEKTFGDVLFAVNRVLFEHPHCVDVWFDDVAAIDEEIALVDKDANHFRKTLRLYHNALAENAVARIDLNEVTRLRNQISIRKDRLAALRPRLVKLISSAMRPGDPCPEVKAVARKP